ncbi:MAG: hypothetical protein AWU54_1119, partial [Candidatus Frackibacter sp. T328-2]
MAFTEMKKYLEEKTDFPVREKYDLPASELRFDGGAHARIEISGVESVSNLETMVKEADKRNITVHRVISLVKGATLLDDQELKYFAQ